MSHSHGSTARWWMMGCLLLLSQPIVAFAQTTPVAEVLSEAEADAPETAGNDESGSKPALETTPDSDAESAGESKPTAAPEPSSEPQQAAESVPADEAKTSKPPRPASPLATSRWRGRTPRWIGLYGSQLADLIPENFRPISIEDLAAALRDNSQSSLALRDAPVQRVVIVAAVDAEQLVSLDSHLVLPAGDKTGADDDGVTPDEPLQRYQLGPINLNLIERAVPQPRASGQSETGASEPGTGIIVSDVTGDCYAIGSGGSTIRFDWSARCQHVAGGRQWSLRFPDATVTQFFLRVDAAEEVLTAGSVATRLPQAPAWQELGIHPDPGNGFSGAEDEGESDSIWYSIELTPGQPFVLQVRAASDQRAAESPAVTVVRGCRMQAQWMGDQLRWTCRLTIDANQASELTEIAWIDGEVTSIQRDNTPIPFQWTGHSARFVAVQPIAAQTMRSRGGEISTMTSTLLIEGISRRQGERVTLPRPLLPPTQFFVPPQIWQWQLETPTWSTLSDIRMPAQWTIRTMPASPAAAANRASNTRTSANGNALTGDETVDAEASTPADGKSISAVQHTAINNLTTSTWIASGPVPSENDPWSVTILPNDALVFAGHQMRFEMDETSIVARGKVAVEMPGGSTHPITLELQDGFQFDFVGVGDARRSAPTGPPTGRGRRLTIWPGSDEVVNDRVVIYVNARARRNNVAGQITKTAGSPSAKKDAQAAAVESSQAAAASAKRNVNTAIKAGNNNPSPGNRGAAIRGDTIQRVGSLWLIRAVDCPGQLLATIIPPANLSWSAEAAIEPSRLPFLELSAEERRFFAPLPGDAIVFGGAIEATPEVSLEKPDINLSVSLRTLLGSVPTTFDGQQQMWGSGRNPSLMQGTTEQIWQTLEVKTEGTAGAIGTIRLRFATPATSAHSTSLPSPPMQPTPLQWPPMQWAVQLQPEQPLVAIDDKSITRQYIKNAGEWEIRIVLPVQFTNQSLLVGRRQHTFVATQPRLAIGLPNVPDAASQAAEVWIDSTLQLSQHSDSLKGVPPLESKTSRPTAANAVSASRRFRLSTSMASSARYRYDPNDQTWIEVTLREHRPPTGLIVSQRITAVASISGTDTLRMSCLTRSAEEIALTFPPSLHLLNVRRDGVVITPRVLPGVGVVIPAPSLRASATLSAARTTAANSVNLAQPRSGDAPRWTRIEANWVLPSPRSHWYRWYEFPPIVMDQLLIDTRHDLIAATGTTVFEIPHWFGGRSQSSSLLLLPSGLLDGVGWVAALMLLGLARFVGSRGLGLIGAGIVLSAIASLLWPAATVALVTFVAVPLTLAALQLSTVRWREDSRNEREAVAVDPSHHSAADAAYPNASTPSGAAPDRDQAIPTTRHRQPRSDSWTRRFQAGEIMSSEIQTEQLPTGLDRSDDSASIDIKVIDDDSETDFSTSSLLPGLLALAISLAGAATSDHRIAAQDNFLTAGAAPANQATETDASSDSETLAKLPSTIDILVPLKSSGEILGNKIYVPEAFYNELFFSDTRLPLQTPLIQQVSYRMRLQSPLANEKPLADRVGFFDENSSNSNPTADGLSELASLTDEQLGKSGAVSLEANMAVTLPVGTRRLRLPYRVEQVIGIVQPDSSSERLTLRWGDDGDGWAWVEIPPPENLTAGLQTSQLMVSLRCDLQWQSPWVVATTELPPLAAASLRVTAGERVQSVMLQSATTSWFVDTDPVAEPVQLGPLRQLSLRFRVQDAGDLEQTALPWQDPAQWQQRFWIHSQSGKTVIECELEPRQSLPPEVVTALSITAPKVTILPENTDAAATPPSTPLTTPARPIPCQLLGRQWTRLRDAKSPDTSSEETPASPVLRLMSLQTPTRPIRLGWALTTPSEGAWRVEMPKVRFAATSSETDRGSDVEPQSQANLPWVAWTFGDDLQPDWSQIGELEPLAVDQFYAKWTGYLSSINRAAVGVVRDVTLRRVVPPRGALATRHEISINGDAQRVRFVATLTPPANTIGGTNAAAAGSMRYAIRLPERGRLLDWRLVVNGVKSTSRFAQSSPSGESSGNSGVNPSATSTGNAGETPITTAESVVEPWTVHRNGEVTTLYLTSDQNSFQVEIDVLVPHSSGDKLNGLALLDFRNISAEPAPLLATNTNPNPDNATTNPELTTVALEQTHELQITRHVDTVVAWATPIASGRIDAGVEDAASLLATGEILLDRFNIAGPLLDTFAAARFHTRREKQTFDLDSRITLRWEEGRWMAQTDCQITSKHCPDYIDIALPTRWCDSLQIDPLCVSSRQPTLDPALQVLRLQLRDETAAVVVDTAAGGVENASDAELGNTQPDPVRVFRLISRLAVSEITRVSVPEVRVIGARRHRIDVVVPTRLTNEQVRWRSNFAGPIEKPRWRSPITDRNELDFARSDSQDSPAGLELSVYAVTSPGWSIDLETLPRTDRVAQLIHADHRVLVRPLSDEWLIVSRFDVLPGDQSSLQLSVASSARLLGVWAATRGADLRMSSSPRDTESIWEVPLPLSRLSQTVEVLTAIRKDTSEILLPVIVGLSSSTRPASVNWCEIPPAGNASPRTIDQAARVHSGGTANFDNEQAATAWITAPIAANVRTQWLASSVVQAIRASSDALADRRDEEVAIWLQPWIVRYRLLCDTAQRTIGDIDDNIRVLNDPVPVDRQKPNFPPGLLSWQEMDAYILSQETRYFADDSFADDAANAGRKPRPSAPTAFGSTQLAAVAHWDVMTAWSDFLAVGRPPGFAERWTFATSDRRLPIGLLAAQRPQLSEQIRQIVMRGGIFIAVASLVILVAIFPRRKTHRNIQSTEATTWQINVMHPSLWLFVLGVIGFVLLPLPIACGLIAAALVLATNPQSGRWWRLPWLANSNSSSLVKSTKKGL